MFSPSSPYQQSQSQSQSQSSLLSPTSTSTSTSTSKSTSVSPSPSPSVPSFTPVLGRRSNSLVVTSLTSKRQSDLKRPTSSLSSSKRSSLTSLFSTPKPFSPYTSTSTSTTISSNPIRSPFSTIPEPHDPILSALAISIGDVVQPIIQLRKELVSTAAALLSFYTHAENAAHCIETTFKPPTTNIITSPLHSTTSNHHQQKQQQQQSTPINHSDPFPPPFYLSLSISLHGRLKRRTLKLYCSFFHSEVLYPIDDWLDDADELLVELGEAQKTRHELDKVQEEMQSLFEKRENQKQSLSPKHSSSSSNINNLNKLDNINDLDISILTTKSQLAHLSTLFSSRLHSTRKSHANILVSRSPLSTSVAKKMLEFQWKCLGGMMKIGGVVNNGFILEEELDDKQEMGYDDHEQDDGNDDDEEEDEEEEYPDHRSNNEVNRTVYHTPSIDDSLNDTEIEVEGEESIPKTSPTETSSYRHVPNLLHSSIVQTNEVDESFITPSRQYSRSGKRRITREKQPNVQNHHSNHDYSDNSGSRHSQSQSQSQSESRSSPSDSSAEEEDNFVLADERKNQPTDLSDNDDILASFRPPSPFIIERKSIRTASHNNHSDVVDPIALPSYELAASLNLPFRSLVRSSQSLLALPWSPILLSPSILPSVWAQVLSSIYKWNDEKDELECIYALVEGRGKEEIEALWKKRKKKQQLEERLVKPQSINTNKREGQFRILTLKREIQVRQGLDRLGLSIEHAIYSIYQFDRIISLERANLLSSIWPTSDELDLLSDEWKEKSDHLSLPSYWVWSVKYANYKPSLKERLDAIQFAHTINRLSGPLLSAYSSIVTAAQVIKSTSSFSHMLALIVELGNYMNSREQVESAYGFSLDLLGRLGKLRNPNNQITLLDFLVSLCARHHPMICNFIAPMKSLSKATKINIHQMEDNIRQILEGMTRWDKIISEEEKETKNYPIPGSANTILFDASTPLTHNENQNKLSSYFISLHTPSRMKTLYATVTNTTTLLFDTRQKTLETMENIATYLNIDTSKVTKDQIPHVEEEIKFLDANLIRLSSSVVSTCLTEFLPLSFDWLGILVSINDFVVNFSFSLRCYYAEEEKRKQGGAKFTVNLKLEEEKAEKEKIAYLMKQMKKEEEEKEKERIVVAKQEEERRILLRQQQQTFSSSSSSELSYLPAFPRSYLSNHPTTSGRTKVFSLHGSSPPSALQPIPLTVTPAALAAVKTLNYPAISYSNDQHSALLSENESRKQILSAAESAEAALALSQQQQLQQQLPNNQPSNFNQLSDNAITNKAMGRTKVFSIGSSSSSPSFSLSSISQQKSPEFEYRSPSHTSVNKSSPSFSASISSSGPLPPTSPYNERNASPSLPPIQGQPGSIKVVRTPFSAHFTYSDSNSKK